MSNPTTGDISPEHTARAMDGDLHPEVKAAYGYVDRVLHTADIQAALGIPAWYGWAIREAFLAGCSHAAPLAQPEPKRPTDEGVEAVARVIYGSMRFDRVDHTAPWVERGNSFAQDEARRCARAVLARCARPTIQPEPVTRKPVVDYSRVPEIATEAQIRSAAQYLVKKRNCAGDLIPAIEYAIARWGTPAIRPVVVSERLPGAGDCDEQGRCWMSTTATDPGWVLDYPERCTKWTHWLHANALPTP